MYTIRVSIHMHMSHCKQEDLPNDTLEEGEIDPNRLVGVFLGRPTCTNSDPQNLVFVGCFKLCYRHSDQPGSASVRKA